jgi:hypothetical protein
VAHCLALLHHGLVGLAIGVGAARLATHVQEELRLVQVLAMRGGFHLCRAAQSRGGQQGSSGVVLLLCSSFEVP